MTIFAKSKVILMQFENFCISLHVSDSAQKKCNFELFGFFWNIKSRLGKMLKSCSPSESFWRLIFEPPKNAKVELWFERELDFRNFRRHLFRIFCETYKKNIKIKLSPAPELNFCGPVPLKNQYSAFALRFAIL